ncbi:DNA polymerase epsilon subunit 3 [Heterocephalus glaber]|uniref:DNA polymerase epsilon subunit 3 n=1 Tax=Heterocephalus glaber TaxID=10181 RepID=G5BKU1_HETGA|nr:DNA polymerase epsilon subunit 3 [Heterocephalus glaber]
MMKGKPKTLNASDVLSAMEEMEFQRFITPLKEALEAYRQEQKGKKEASEQKKDKDKKTDSEEQDRSRDEDNDEAEERIEEQNEADEVDS